MKEFTRQNEVFETIAVLLIALETSQSYRLSNPYHCVVQKSNQVGGWRGLFRIGY
jgi:hypothetical protein